MAMAAPAWSPRLPTRGQASRAASGHASPCSPCWPSWPSWPCSPSRRRAVASIGSCRQEALGGPRRALVLCRRWPCLANRQCPSPFKEPACLANDRQGPASRPQQIRIKGPIYPFHAHGAQGSTSKARPRCDPGLCEHKQGPDRVPSSRHDHGPHRAADPRLALLIPRLALLTRQASSACAPTPQRLVCSPAPSLWLPPHPSSRRPRPSRSAAHPMTGPPLPRLRQPGP